MKRKIAIIAHHASPLAALGVEDHGGEDVYVSQISAHLARLGYEVDIFTRWEDPKQAQVVDFSEGVRIIHIKAGPKKVIPKENLLPFMGEFANEMLKFIYFEGKAYDLMHANYFMSGLVAMNIKRTLNIPFVITFHSLGKVRRLHQGNADKFSDERFDIEEEVIKEADGIVGECPQDRKDLIELYWADSSKIKVVPCGFDRSEIYPVDKQKARKTLNLSSNEKYILQLGRLVPRKGIDNVIQALSLLVHKHKISAKLLVVGGESDDPQKTPEIAKLMKLAKDENVEKDVIFTGRKDRSEIKYYFSASDVFVSTPWYEPFGITPVESMACGTPVIGSSVGGIKYTVEHGKSGLLVPPKNPEALADALVNVLSNPKLAGEFRTKGIERVNAFFTWEIVALELSSLYEKVLNSFKSSSFGFDQIRRVFDHGVRR